MAASTCTTKDVAAGTLLTSTLTQIKSLLATAIRAKRFISCTVEATGDKAVSNNDVIKAPIDGVFRLTIEIKPQASPANGIVVTNPG
jgi:hypothetical protein